MAKKRRTLCFIVKKNHSQFKSNYNSASPLIGRERSRLFWSWLNEARFLLATLVDFHLFLPRSSRWETNLAALNQSNTRNRLGRLGPSIPCTNERRRGRLANARCPCGLPHYCTFLWKAQVQVESSHGEVHLPEWIAQLHEERKSLPSHEIQHIHNDRVVPPPPAVYFDLNCWYPFFSPQKHKVHLFLAIAHINNYYTWWNFFT